MPKNAVTLAANFEAIPSGPSVSPASLTIQEGKTATFTVSLGEGGNEADSAAVRSGDTNIATVSPATVNTSPMAVTVTGIKPGATDITVEFVGGTYGGGSKTVSVTVTAAEGKIISAPDENTPLDLGKDAVFAFSGSYANLAAVRLDGHVLTQTAINETQADLSGYPGYTKVLGDVKSGSVIVTLYKEFLQTLPDGKHTLTVEFADGSTTSAGSAQFTIEKPEPKAPKTGDESNMALWTALVCAAGVCIAGAWLYRRRKFAR